jgi:hypothetical protein
MCCRAAGRGALTFEVYARGPGIYERQFAAEVGYIIRGGAIPSQVGFEALQLLPLQQSSSCRYAPMPAYL